MGREHRSALPRRRHCLHGVLARATPRPHRALGPSSPTASVPRPKPALLDAHRDARLVPIEATWGRDTGAGRQILPGQDGRDGFFYALLHKAAAPSPAAASHRAARSRSAGRALAEPPRANHGIADTLPLHKRVERPILRAGLVHLTMVVRKSWRPCATVLISVAATLFTICECSETDEHPRVQLSGYPHCQFGSGRQGDKGFALTHSV
jgi:hypothetical protein